MMIFIAPNYKEHHRFNRFFLEDGDMKLSYSSFRDVIKLSQLAYQDNIIFVFNGLRLPDIFALKFLQSINAEIILLQHNSHVQVYSLKQVIKKFLGNIKKYIPWAMICTYFFVLRYLNNKSKSESTKSPHCFIYGHSYKNKISTVLKNPSINFMPEPNMLQYGSIEDLKIVDKHINILFIDEPFETTLGSSSADIVSQILAKNEKELIYIKLHPRSDSNKYNTLLLDNIRFIDYIPSSISKLYGFKSNLFSYIKFCKKRYVYNPEFNVFKQAIDENKDYSATGSYIEKVKSELNNFRH